MKSKDNNAKIILREVLSWIAVPVVAIFIALFVNSTIIVNATVPTHSMANTVVEGARIMGSRLSYVFSDPQRFDVIAFDSPDGTDTTYLKRIIGLPGETLEIINGLVYINGSSAPLDEWYLLEPPVGWSLINQRFEIPEGTYFVMGDNRNDSKDSRGLGANAWQNIFIPKENILGRVSFTYFPHIGRVR
ncbi:MAG: signal peptidase I [Defluviitaleaceae bacterium]|nr:signal peptidase I [Defluviitaleaceae bacterium]